jgi:DNA-binding transcriptional MocR family regulator
MEIAVDRGSGVPLARQIASAILSAIERRELQAGARLPAERDLASRLGVDRMTVARAYEALASEGFVVRQVGRGTFVADRLPAAAGGGDEVSALPWASAFSDRSSALGPGPVGALHAPAPDGAVNLGSHFPDPSLFPVRDFRRAMDAAIRREGARLFGYGPAGGYPPLRRYVAGWLTRRGAAVEEDEVVVTNGSQQGIDLVARVLLDPGDRVAVENPTYTGAVQVFQSHGARVLGIPLDGEGMRPDRLAEALARSPVRLLYVIPNFQNPTSGTLSLERRRSLLAVAARHGVPVLEDDFGGDLRFEGEEIPSLKALDRRGAVIYVGSFAKKLLPGLRIGWVAAPREAAEKIGLLKQVTDWNTSLLLQAALHEFCRLGMMERHLRRVLGAYRERRDAMVEAMRRHFPRDVRWTRPEGGLVVWVTLPPGVSAESVALEARGRGVVVGRGDLFYVDGGGHGNLRLVYAQASPDQIRRGIRILGSVLKEQSREGREAAVSGAIEALPII